MALGIVAALAFAGVIGPAAADSATTHTKTYTTPGVSTFTVPANVSHITVTAVGAAGGNCSGPITKGGEGASDTATFAVKPGSKLIVGVGGKGGDCSYLQGPSPGGAGGVNGGGAGASSGSPYGGPAGAGGGGASGVLISATKPLIVAGGGGGGSGCGGDGGNADSPGTDGSSCSGPTGFGGGGGAGTTSGGGAGGAAGDSNAKAGGPGTVENGGAGGMGDPTTGQSAGGGGGGGGLYGGGGGGGSATQEGAGGGGGGASFVSTKGTNVTAPAPTTASASVTITYTAAPRPTATTHKATGVKSTSATLHGSVNGEGLATTYWFQWGTSKAYGHKTRAHKLKGSSKAKSVAAVLRGLKPGTRYHFRVVAKTASGTSRGKDMTFTTKAATATGPVFTG